MGLIDSKNIIILIIGILFSLLFTLFPSFYEIDFRNIYTIYIILFFSGLVILGIIWFLSTRTTELYSIVENQQEEQKKLSEKLKIYEQLIDIKADINNLKEKCKK